MMTRWIASASLVGALATGAGSTATAQSATAMLRYDNGTRLYAMHRFVEAAHEFEAAYTLSQQAELLFNLGRAWEDAGEISAALDAYLRFEAAGAPGYDLTQLRSRIGRLRGTLSAAQATAVAVAPTPSPTAVGTPPAPRPPSAPSLVGPIVLMSLGGAALVSVIPLWVSARTTHNDLSSVCPTRTCATVFQGDAARASSFALAGDVLLGVGAASLATGVTWWLLGRRERVPEGARRVTLGCTTGGCVAGLAGSF